MKKMLTAVALTCFAATGGLSAAGTAAADTGGVNLPSVVPLSGVLTPKAKPAAGTPHLPPANTAVERLLPGH
ncbi:MULTISPECIES: hypothetical protein [unclassified Streptomyces]|uniref:hypothetical protein n=1 Tax=unclassified Streptomyces TaxID=2593676 RepID=UPI0006F2E745|nr:MULTISPECIES: hypothetical protein [unclassified Streptomyces]KQX58008.1 hypothetical protein ASD33_26360 [Streptomyces sp. Root1304]KRA95408.1 hypothetical protein ASE09_28510 [Streptomyces sp. Root66D1]